MLRYFIKTNSKSIVEYDTQNPYITSIEKKTVVTGKVIPEDEVEIKPQIPGIIESLFVEEIYLQRLRLSQMNKL